MSQILPSKTRSHVPNHLTTDITQVGEIILGDLAQNTAQEIVDQLQLELAPAGRPKKPKTHSVQPDSISLGIGNDADDVLTPNVNWSPTKIFLYSPPFNLGLAEELGNAL